MLKFQSREVMTQTLCKNGDIGAEIGVFAGDFSQFLLTTNPSQLFLIDCWQKQDGDYARDVVINNLVTSDLYINVANKFKENVNVFVWRMFSKEALILLPDQYFDWIYLDADHTYYSVVADLKGWIKKIKIGGLFLGHDYMMTDWIDVKKAVDEFTELDFITEEEFAPSWGFIRKPRFLF